MSLQDLELYLDFLSSLLPPITAEESPQQQQPQPREPALWYLDLSQIGDDSSPEEPSSPRVGDSDGLFLLGF